MRADVVVLPLEGELDIATVEEVEAALDGAGPGCDLIVDLSRATFLDSVTLSRFVRAARQHQDHGTHVVLADARDSVRRVLTITQLDQLVPYADTVEQARDLLERGPAGATAT